MLRKYLCVGALICVIAWPVIWPATTAAASNLFGQPCGQGGTSSVVCNTPASSNPVAGPNGIIVKVTRIVAVFGGAIAVIMMIVGGIMYVLSAGDANKVNTAKDTILYAAVGLLIIALAQAIVVFVVDRI
ncbi:MAG TPA: hypothetical protein VGS08_01940 [Candidatus Saccharimonadales bacterium]|nr:hypothetical protein [Candidatus Saccharimonadales bacterium]